MAPTASWPRTPAVGNAGTSNAVVFTLETQAPGVKISTATETSNVATQSIAGVVTAGDAARRRHGMTLNLGLHRSGTLQPKKCAIHRHFKKS